MYINGTKYACATCIKGHRSSHCNHVDRPLLEIRKKGRPVTQCSLCRDLRKTKQVHIKCACNDKKENTNSNQQQQQQPVYYRNNTLVDEQDVKKSPLNQVQDTQPTSSSQVTRDPFVAPLCPTAPPMKEEDMSYSWALITSPTVNHLNLESPSPPLKNIVNNNYLGFTFHKPPSQRFLNGQPRVRRRKSTKKTNIAPPNFIDTVNVNPCLSTPPSSTVSPHPPSSSSSASAAVCEPMDMQFEYLTEQLELLSQDGIMNTFSPEPNDLLATNNDTEELTAILNNVLSEAAVPVQQRPAPINRSHCGSFVPNPTCCQSKGPGESVIITITPLVQDNQPQDNSPTTTRIVTCYCGQHCTCPGCLVHPNNFFLGNDPYTGPFIPSSSSSCYGSDEEEQHHYLQHFP